MARLGRRPLVAAYLAGLVPALLMAVTQPVWSRVDEAQHVDFIVQLSHGVYPVPDRTVIDNETLRLMQQTHVFRFESPGSYPEPDLEDIGPPPEGMSKQANVVWMSRHLWQLSYESAQPPGYYVLMVPFWSVADRLGGTLAAVYVLRIINALLIALLAPMAFAVADRISPGRREIAFLAALFGALLPGLALTGTRVSNDGLAAVLGGAVVLIAVANVARAWTWRRAFLIGATLGIGLLVKVTLIGMVPAIAVAMLWPGGGSSWGQRTSRGILAASVAAACLVPWLLINTYNYGALSPLGLTGRLTQTLPMPVTPALVALDVAFFLVTYWAGEPLDALPFAEAFVVLGCLLALVAVIGLARAARQPDVSRARLVVAITAVVAMLGLTLTLPSASGFDFLSPGRYAYLVLPASAALMAVGVAAALAREFARRALTGLYAIIAAATLVGGALGLPQAPSPGISDAPPAGADVMSVAAGGNLGSFSIQVDHIALDPISPAMWIHVTATNGGQAEVEWSASASATANGQKVMTDYARSTHLPGDVEAGRSVSGWMYLPLTVRRGDALELRFADVALDGYRTVDDVTVQFSV